MCQFICSQCNFASVLALLYVVQAAQGEWSPTRFHLWHTGFVGETKFPSVANDTEELLL